MRPCFHDLTWKTLINEHRHHDILKCRKCGDEIVTLENETNAMSSQFRKFRIVELARFLVIDEQLSRCWSVKQANDIQQRAFARTGWAH